MNEIAHLECAVCRGYRSKVKKLLATPTTVENNRELHRARSEFTDHLEQHKQAEGRTT